MIFDRTHVHLTVPARETRRTPHDARTLGGLGAPVNEEDIREPRVEKHATSDLGAEVSHGCLEQRLLWQKKNLIIEIAVKEEHISILQDGLDNWTTLTESARKKLGRYHTHDDILRTLICEVSSLRRLKYEIDWVDHVLLHEKNPTRGVTHVKTHNSQGKRG